MVHKLETRQLRQMAACCNIQAWRIPAASGQRAPHTVHDYFAAHASGSCARKDAKNQGGLFGGHGQQRPSNWNIETHHKPHLKRHHCSSKCRPIVSYSHPELHAIEHAAAAAQLLQTPGAARLAAQACPCIDPICRLHWQSPYHPWWCLTL